MMTSLKIGCYLKMRISNSMRNSTPSLNLSCLTPNCSNSKTGWNSMMTTARMSWKMKPNSKTKMKNC